MGLNVDLVSMLGVPKRARCPTCRKDVATRFDCYDIECGDPNPSSATWALDAYCEGCDRPWKIRYRVLATEVPGPPGRGPAMKPRDSGWEEALASGDFRKSLRGRPPSLLSRPQLELLRKLPDAPGDGGFCKGPAMRVARSLVSKGLARCSGQNVSGHGAFYVRTPEGAKAANA